MKTLINIKADKAVKEDAQKLAQELGLSLSAVVNAQLKQFIRSRSVYLSAIPRMSPGLESLLGTVERDIKAGKNLSKAFSSSEEIAEYLDML